MMSSVWSINGARMGDKVIKFERIKKDHCDILLTNGASNGGKGEQENI